MTTIVEIPGIGEVEFPDSMSRAEIAAAAKGLFDKQQAAPPAPALPTLPPNGPLRSPLDDPLLGPGIREGAARAVAGAQPPAGQPDPDGALAFTRAFARRLGDNILATPELLADVILPRLMPRPGGTGPLDLISQGISGVTGGAVDPAAAAERVRERVRQGGHVIDLPSTTDIAAGIDVALGGAPAEPGLGLLSERRLPPQRRTAGPQPVPGAAAPGLGEQFRAAQEEQMVTDIQMAEGAPFATGAGGVAGDIATLLTGRAALRGSVPLQQIAPTVAARSQSILGRVIQTTGRALARTGIRAAETGGEAAFLAALQDADPLEVGAVAAGIQGGTAPLRAAVLQLRKPTVLASALFMATSAHLAMQQWTPGGLDRVLPTLEGKNKEIWAAMLLGGPSLLLGRLPANFAPGKTFGPAFAEMVNVLPRGAMNSLLASYMKDSARIDPVLAKFAEDPDFFGPKAKRLLTRALTTEDIDLSGTLDRLMEEREFRRRFQALTADEAL